MLYALKLFKLLPDSNNSKNIKIFVSGDKNRARTTQSIIFAFPDKAINL